MSIKPRLDGFERKLQMAEAALIRAGHLRRPVFIVNDPEDEADLAEHRLYGIDQSETIEIASDRFEEMQTRSARFLSTR
jgi:hypothetical protein